MHLAGRSGICSSQSEPEHTSTTSYPATVQAAKSYRTRHQEDLERLRKGRVNLFGRAIRKQFVRVEVSPHTSTSYLAVTLTGLGPLRRGDLEFVSLFGIGHPRFVQVQVNKSNYIGVNRVWQAGRTTGNRWDLVR